MEREHESFMQRALELAARGGRAVAPNPMVGAVITHDGTIVGEGWHALYGDAHAEVVAIRAVKDPTILPRATLYVTLEPCAHYGKTPPCVDLLIRSGIGTVVVGCRDPFPEVAGKGIARLKEHGITVVENVCRDACCFLNRRFMVRQLMRRPYIVLKWAQTRDGYMARGDGSSKWISCESSRRLVHKWRALEPVIMVGSGTAAIDDPRLTVRGVPGLNPLRVVLDRRRTIPTSSHIFNHEAETLVVTCQEASLESIRSNIQTLTISPQEPPLPALFTALYQRGVLSIMIEGGAKLLQECINQSLWDEARVFTSQEEFDFGLPAPHLMTMPFFNTPIDTDDLSLTANPKMLAMLGGATPYVDPLFKLDEEK